MVVLDVQLTDLTFFLFAQHPNIMITSSFKAPSIPKNGIWKPHNIIIALVNNVA